MGILAENSASAAANEARTMVEEKVEQKSQKALHIVTYNGEKYDISKFIERHPGGTDVLLNAIETYKGDITKPFEDIGHSKKATSILSKYKIVDGDNKEETQTMKEATESDNKDGARRKKEPMDVAFIKKKLFTNEDPYYVHKIFGLLSVLSFTYRYFYVLPRQGNLGMDGSLFDHLTLAVHLFLSSSSLIFHVLKKRILSKPIIIWEEYRLHAIVFTLKSVSASLYGMHYQTIVSYIGEPYSKLALPALMFLHLFLVDEITRRYGTEGVTSVRNDGNSKIVGLKYILMFFSYYQFNGAASHYITNERLGDLGYNTIIAIQSSAFLMTLFRKSIIKWYVYIIWYGGCLVLSLYYMSVVKGPSFLIETLSVMLLRVNFSVSKYVLWVIFIASHLYRPEIVLLLKSNGIL